MSDSNIIAEFYGDPRPALIVEAAGDRVLFNVHSRHNVPVAAILDRADAARLHAALGKYLEEKC